MDIVKPTSGGLRGGLVLFTLIFTDLDLVGYVEIHSAIRAADLGL